MTYTNCGYKYKFSEHNIFSSLQGERVEMMDDDATLVGGGGGGVCKSATSLPNPARSFAGAGVAGWVTFLCRCGCARAIMVVSSLCAIMVVASLCRRGCVRACGRISMYMRICIRILDSHKLLV